MKDTTPAGPENPTAAPRLGSPAEPGRSEAAGPAVNTAAVNTAALNTASQTTAAPAPGNRKAAVLDCAGALAVAALIVVPLWMLLGNPAVLGGHPALPALLVGAVGLGLAWAFVLVRRSGVFTHNGLRTRRRHSGGGSRWHLFRGLLGRLAVLGFVAGLAWLNPFPHQPSGAAGQRTGTTTEDATSITLAPQGTATAGLVFYPGARVDAHAYRDILGPLANAGYLVVILKAPLGISLLDTGQARGVVDRHPEITAWAVGGHSLGGVSASSFASSSQDVSGLLLFASYPADNMTESRSLAVLSISGSRDGLSTPEKITASKALLPPTTSYATVEGGVHAFFGDYGEQPGDGEPGITRDQAQQQITAESVRFMDGLRIAG